MITAIVMINGEQKSVNIMMDELLQIEGISEVYQVAGEFDIVAVIRAKDGQELSKIITDTMPHHIDGIVHAKTFISLCSKAKINLEEVFKRA